MSARDSEKDRENNVSDDTVNSEVITWAKYSRISLPLKSVLCSRSLASAAARASLKLILTRRKDLKYWNCTSGSNERNRASKLVWKETEEEDEDQNQDK